MKDENSVQDSFSVSMEGSSLRDETLRKTAMGRESGQSVVGKRNGIFE